MPASRHTPTIGRWSFVRALQVALVASLSLAAPFTAQSQAHNGPIVQIVPRSTTVVGSSSIAVTFYLCGDAYGYDISSLSITLNDVDVSGYFTAGIVSPPAWFSNNCVWKEQYSGTLPLTAQNNHFRVYIVANDMYLPGADAVDYDLPKPPTGVAVNSSAMYATAAPGAVASRKFSVANTTATGDSYTLSLSCIGQAGTCTMNSGTSVTLAGGQSTDITVSVPVPGSPGATAFAKLIARSQSNTATVDSSWSEVTATAQPAQGVVLATTPDYVNRPLCTRIAVIGGAIECGDLMLDHPLPPLQTMGRTWVPTLLYNSQTAAPNPIIAANVTVSGSQPDSVTARVVFRGAQVATGRWSGAEWGSSGTRRIALGWSAVSVPTGLYDYTFEVSRWNAGTRTVIGSPSGKLALVNRSSSVFGAGVWLAGLESLVETNDGTNNKMWVGGDGSAHVYTYLGNNRWVGRNVTTPDTLTYNSYNGLYSRWLPGRGHVDFNTALQQVATVNHNAWGSAYEDDGSGRRSRIRLPVRTASSTAMRYDVAYDNNVHVTFTAVGGTATRSNVITLSSGNLWAIYDAAGNPEYFESLTAQPQRLIARTDTRGTRTAYTYAPDFTVRSVSTPITGQTIASTYVDSRSRGVVVTAGAGTSSPLDSAYSMYDGPRTDLVDIAGFWENPYGAPVRVRDALGGESRITYSTTWPGLVSEVRDAAHLVTSSVIDPSTGLTLSTTATNAFADSRNQTTSYVWDNYWRVPVRIINPANDSTVIVYLTSGNRYWQQPGGDASRRVTFGYDNSFGQVSSVSGPLVPASTVVYDSLGNVSSSTTPAGWTSTSVRDAFGRAVLETSPIDATHSSVVATEYDVMGRVSAVTTRGPAMGGVPADSIRLTYAYDSESNRTNTSRWFMSGGLWQHLQHTWSYDGAGRLTQEVDDDGATTTLAYDPAGNTVARTNPRNLTVSTTYDALNRPLRRTEQLIQFGQYVCQLPNGFYCSYTFPTRGSSLTLIPDTAAFGYDAAGRMTSARNRYARISRTYAPNGALLTDELRIRRVLTEAPSPGEQVTPPVGDPYIPDDWYGGDPGGGGGGGCCEQQSVPIGGTVDTASTLKGKGKHGNGGSSQRGGTAGGVIVASVPNGGVSASDATGVGMDADFTQHIYLTRYHYDLDGRRDTLYFPFGGKKQSYSYNNVTGLLDQIVDALGYTHSVTRDTRDRVVTETSPGWTVTKGYNADDQLTSYNGAALTVDALGRVTYTALGAGATFAYDGLGHLLQSQDDDADATLEQFSYDALGNRNYSHRLVSNPWAGDDGVRYTTTSLTGRVGAIGSNPAVQQYYYLTQEFEYDQAGNATHESSREQVTSSFNHYWETHRYYDASDRMRVFDQHTGLSATSDMFGPGQRHGVFEEYWYDALGRRVFVRSRYDRGCATTVDSECYSAARRIVWDGDQVLHEIRADGSDSTVATTMDSDNQLVSYAHFGSLRGVDAPVAVMKGTPSAWTTMVVPHLNWRAVYDTGNVVVGTMPLIRWPGSTETLDQSPNSRPHQQWAWYGEVIGGNRDGSGEKYMRNRYYDPATATFTQKDPIGLAGGMNLYGFAGGDPVNFSDPFGLWPGGPSKHPGVLGTMLAGIGTVIQKRIDSFVASAKSGGLAKTMVFGIIGSIGAAAPGEVGVMPEVIFRGGTPSPGNLTPRAVDGGALSFRSSLSSPIEGPPVFRAGEPFFGLATSKLPPGSVTVDANPDGHVSLRGVSVQAAKDAVVVRGKIP